MYRVAHFLIYAVVGANVVGIIDLSLHQPEMMIGEFQTQISRQARLLENKKILNMITIGIKRRLMITNILEIVSYFALPFFTKLFTG